MTAATTATTSAQTRHGERISNADHAMQPWRIHAFTADFTLEDVWRLPVEGDVDDFDDLVTMMTSTGDLVENAALPARFLWVLRDRLGDLLNLGGIEDVSGDGSECLPIPGSTETSLRGRLPTDLKDTASNVHFNSTPFTPLFRTDTEFAAEMSNTTVHAIMHLAWVRDSGERYHGEMAVYVKPRGVFGQGYMAFIKPFRYLVVYPALLTQMGRTWKNRTPLHH